VQAFAADVAAGVLAVAADAARGLGERTAVVPEKEGIERTGFIRLGR
jgi:hypothetical protein